MDLDQLERFFLWCMLINTGIYLLTAIALVVMRGFVYAVHKRLFNMDPDAVNASTQAYLSRFKLFITVFNFTPWVALLIMRQV